MSQNNDEQSNQSISTQHNAYQHVTIIGNACGEWQPAEQGLTFTFNATGHDADHVVNICNGPYSGSIEDFVVNNSPDDPQLVLLLTQVGKTLETQLHCKPSSGLVTTFLMSLISQQVNVQRMSLLPSLCRPSDMEVKEYLPCVMHNWLGERRLALGLQLTSTNINWPELFLNDAPMNIEQNPSAEQPDINPFEILLADYLRRINTNGTSTAQKPFSFTQQSTLALQATTERPQDIDVQYAILAALTNLPSVHWLSYATQDDLITAESLFYNQFPDKQLSYWYLVDYQASQYLDTIRHHLAYCQQVIALTAKQEYP